ncbi:MAG: LysR family transcriptional regulator [Oscillospiraceae bacterium]|nr:LysR family transcriptional regulator [Oscillospiraceae bacterium]
MNLQHLKYAVEVEKTGSITQAAENLYMGQPNLSKAIKELENTLGVAIFKRTSKGVLPTAQGQEFLRYAKSILDQVERMEELYRSGGEKRLHFTASVPRASYITHAFAQFVAGVDKSQQIDVNFKETNSVDTIHSVAERESKLGIIRYQVIHEHYFQNLLADKAIDRRPLWDFTYRVLFSKRHPLASAKSFTPDDLQKYVEILHGDVTVPSLSVMGRAQTKEDQHAKKKIRIYERGSQFDLLCQVPDTFMWVSPMPQEVLDRYGLVQRKCDVIDFRMKDLLIYPEGYRFSALDEAFIQQVEQVRDEISRKEREKREETA